MKGTPGWRPALLSLGAGAVTFVVGNAVESAVVSAVHANANELRWISDVVVSAGLATVAFLWLHLRAAQRQLTDLERARIAFDAQLRLAAQIQANLLPNVPERTEGFRWAARLVSAQTVGGDFYDFAQRQDGTVLVIVGDVSGKGIPAALVHASLRALFREAARATSDPAEIAARLSQELYADNGGTPYATAFLARFETRPARLSYVNAGHPPGILRWGTSQRILESSAPPLGLLPSAAFSTRRLDLRNGEVGVIVTDGITEALEGLQTTPAALLGAGDDRLSDPAVICDLLLDAAGKAPGPPGVSDWQDDRTAFVFAVLESAGRASSEGEPAAAPRAWPGP